MKTVIIKEVQSWSELPARGMQVFRADFDTIALDRVLSEIDFSNQWLPYGYNYAILCRGTKTLHLFLSI